MIKREDILSLEYLKKTEYTGCHQGMRYRLEGVTTGEEHQIKVTVWPEPFNYFKTPEEQKISSVFAFSEEGVIDVVKWMNERLTVDKEKWDHSADNWTSYQL